MELIQTKGGLFDAEARFQIKELGELSKNFITQTQKKFKELEKKISNAGIAERVVDLMPEYVDDRIK